MKDLFAKMFKKARKEFFTVPNLLSILRILLIPVIVHLYCVEKNDLWTFIVVAFSALTDVVDGYIARKFNLITDFGMFIDPVADKATQIVVFLCLTTRFPAMWVPAIVLLIKEVGSLILRMIVYKETELVDGAKWHGKVSTTIVVSVVALHLIWGTIPSVVSLVIIAFSTLFMLYSGALYTIEAFKMLKTHEKQI